MCGKMGLNLILTTFTERPIENRDISASPQMHALRKYRAKAQQVVRVEGVTVHDGGQATVGDLSHGGSIKDGDG